MTDAKTTPDAAARGDEALTDDLRPGRLSAAPDAVVDAVMADVERAARAALGQGRVADYIPALAEVAPQNLGMALILADGRERVIGQGETPFSIQSVSKLFTFAFALDALGEDIWRRVGREPSGMRFNSLILLEHEHGRPRNPFINAGAIVLADAMTARLGGDWSETLVAHMRRLSANDALAVDEAVYASEEEHGDLNRAIAWFLKAKGNLRTPPETATRAYFRGCSLAMSCLDLARAARFLIAPQSAPGPCRRSQALRRIHAVMRTCGLYDAAGDFAYRVGLPAKSGVGGGVVAVSPNDYAVAVWSPALDEKGNSVAGVRALETLVEAAARWAGPASARAVL